MENKGSPETLRETTFFQFEEFYQQNNFPRQSKHFYEWFLGFAEGDGSFLISITKDTRQPTAKAKPRAFFTLVQKDPGVLYTIKKKFGFGNVQKHNEAFR
jgi:hypothetical protein